MKKKQATRRSSKLTIDEIQTRSLVLVDEHGKARATMCCLGNEDGTSGFTLIQINDDAGRPRIELQVDHKGNPSIRLSTPNDGGGVSIGVNDGLGNGLSVGDHEGKPCIIIGVPHPDSGDPRTHPEITILDPQSCRGWTAFSGSYVIPNH